jgi:nucleoside-diphosphate-sugar epimerase
MRVLVLGGTRFIGPPAVHRLLSLGHEVAVFHRGQTKTPLPSEVRSFYGDRKQLADFSDDFRAYKPDVVLDTLTMTEQDAKTVVETFTDLARRLVVLSSGDVYRAYDRLTGKDPGPPDPTPLTEDSPLRDKLFHYRDAASGPDDRAYHYDKILVERVVTSRPDELPATVLRLPMVFGPGDYQHRLFSYLKRVDDKRPFIILPEGQATVRALRGYVEDMAEAIALCVTKEGAANRIYNVAYQENFTEEAFTRLVTEAAGWTGEIVKIPSKKLPKHLAWNTDENPAQDWSVDSGRIRRELGYQEVVPLEEALRRTIAWERANPPEKIDPARFDYPAEDALMAQLRR